MGVAEDLFKREKEQLHLVKHLGYRVWPSRFCINAIAATHPVERLPLM